MLRLFAWLGLAWLSLGMGSEQLKAQTVDNRNAVIAIQQSTISELRKDLNDLKLVVETMKAEYLKKGEAGNTYITKLDASNQFTTDEEVMTKLKNCVIRLGYSRANQTSISTPVKSNRADSWVMTELVFPSGVGPNDKIHYDINCVPLIIGPIGPIIIDPIIFN